VGEKKRHFCRGDVFSSFFSLCFVSIEGADTGVYIVERLAQVTSYRHDCWRSVITVGDAVYCKYSTVLEYSKFVRPSTVPV